VLRLKKICENGAKLEIRTIYSRFDGKYHERCILIASTYNSCGILITEKGKISAIKVSRTLKKASHVVSSGRLDYVQKLVDRFCEKFNIPVRFKIKRFPHFPGDVFFYEVMPYAKVENKTLDQS